MGIVSTVLGTMILPEWLVSGLWVIGLFVTIELMLNGWSSVGESEDPGISTTAA